MYIRQPGIALLAGSFLLAAGIAHAGSFTAVQSFPPGQDPGMIAATLTQSLTEQGFQDVTAQQNGGQILVSGKHDYKIVKLAYDPMSGNLISATEMTDWDALSDVHDR